VGTAAIAALGIPLLAATPAAAAEPGSAPQAIAAAGVTDPREGICIPTYGRAG
jgi:hypothetical protein